MNRRGFTLLELLIALGITSAVVAGISIILVKQSQASVKQSQQRTLEETGRQALLEIAHSVRMAGAGIDPTAAFDFDHYGCSSAGVPETCNGNPGIDVPPTVTSTGLRDKTDGSDELVVSYRDPTFFRAVIAINGTDPYTVTFDGLSPLKNAISKGRIAMLVCSGADPVAYLAVLNPASPGDTSVTLRSVTDADGYYPKALPADNCFKKSAMGLVERVRYFVANDTDKVPSLFRDRGRTGDPQVLFRGIEDLQLAYTIGPPPAGSPSVGAGKAGCGDGWKYGICNPTRPLDERAVAPDWMNEAYDSPSRFTEHPANIRSVEIGIVARSIATVPDTGGSPFPTNVANRTPPAADPAHPYARSVFSIVEQTPNLLSRARVMPSAAGGG